jgi:peroxiredoxin
VAPDFTLRREDRTGSVTLSALRGKPVVLVFGSFT